jgi:hypothetical protein
MNIEKLYKFDKALKQAVENSNNLQEIVFMTNKFVNETNFTYDNGAIHEHTAEVKFIHELVTFIEENVIHCAMNNNYK